MQLIARLGWLLRCVPEMGQIDVKILPQQVQRFVRHRIVTQRWMAQSRFGKGKLKDSDIILHRNQRNAIGMRMKSIPQQIVLALFFSPIDIIEILKDVAQKVLLAMDNLAGLFDLIREKLRAHRKLENMLIDAMDFYPFFPFQRPIMLHLRNGLLPLFPLSAPDNAAPSKG